tara:strand:- start:875 stop:1003 length:129 start_codon:yes stop_codon:yes gene_type:complete
MVIIRKLIITACKNNLILHFKQKNLFKNKKSLINDFEEENFK